MDGRPPRIHFYVSSLPPLGCGGAAETRWQPPNLFGGGALKRSGKSRLKSKRFSAGLQQWRFRSDESPVSILVPLTIYYLCAIKVTGSSQSLNAGLALPSLP